MEQSKKSKLLLAASVVGFAWWIVILITFFTLKIISLTAPFFEELTTIELLELVLCLLVLTGSWALNLIGWKKSKKLLTIIAIALYVLSLNALPVLLCVTGLLWDNTDEFSKQGKSKNNLFILAGILGICGLAFWLVPLSPRADGTGSESLFIAIVSVPFSEEYNPEGLLFLKVCVVNYAITILASFALSITICFFGKLRNNAKKALIAAILYLISLSIPSAVLCFIGRAQLKKQSAVPAAEK